MTSPTLPSPLILVHWRLTWINLRPVQFIQSGGQAVSQLLSLSVCLCFCLSVLSHLSSFQFIGGRLDHQLCKEKTFNVTTMVKYYLVSTHACEWSFSTGHFIYINLKSYQKVRHGQGTADVQLSLSNFFTSQSVFLPFCVTSSKYILLHPGPFPCHRLKKIWYQQVVKRN